MISLRFKRFFIIVCIPFILNFPSYSVQRKSWKVLWMLVYLFHLWGLIFGSSYSSSYQIWKDLLSMIVEAVNVQIFKLGADACLLDVWMDCRLPMTPQISNILVPNWRIALVLRFFLVVSFLSFLYSFYNFLFFTVLSSLLGPSSFYHRNGLFWV